MMAAMLAKFPLQHNPASMVLLVRTFYRLPVPFTLHIALNMSVGSHCSDLHDYGWLVGWLVFILRLVIRIKSTISPPEGHIRRAKLWNYSAVTLP
jgi:hypothetical protein